MKIGFCITVIVLAVSVVGAQIPPVERDALVALYNSTDGDHWSESTNWLGAAGTECDWFGVYCVEGHVTSLGLSSNLLSGTIPPELGNLSYLEGLYLDANSLTGSIPPELQYLASLKWLFVRFNQLSGSIPPELGNMVGLQWLYLDSNQLEGTIPPELGNLSSLVVLCLGSNRLSGQIPPELGNLLNLAALLLDTNQLSGGIPPELESLSNLTTLALNFNQLTGTVPLELGNLSGLQSLYLHFNQLEGSIPHELGGLSSLTGLYLHGNRLSGEIPSELGDLSELVQLHLGSNRLSGSVPPELGSLSNLSGTNIGYNALWTDNGALQAFLDSKDPDWGETQTTAPETLTVVSVSDQTAWLEWAPISYTGDGGGYEVFFDDLTGQAGSAGCTSDKTIFTFPVTELQPDHAYEFTVATFTMPHPNNQNIVSSEPSLPVMATTSNSGNTAPGVTIVPESGSSTLTAEDGHDTYEWSTGETTSSIIVSPSGPTFYWVRATGPDTYDEAAVVLIDPSLIFFDGFDSGDLTGWSNALP